MQKTINIKLHVTTERDDIRIVKTLRRGLFTALDSPPHHIAPPDNVVIEDINIDDHDEGNTESNAELGMYKNASVRQRERITELKKEVKELTEQLQEVPEPFDQPFWDYRLIDTDAFDGSSVEIMNNMGDNGWELVSYSDIIHSPKSEGYYLVRMAFKRPR